MIVIDASVLANVVGADGADGQRPRHEVRVASDITAPDPVEAEAVAVLRKRWLAGAVDDRRFAEAVGDLEQLDFERVPTLRLARRAYELRANVAAHDATYKALAETLDCVLFTADQRLADAPWPRCQIRELQ
ncbi:MAG TPA: type II toxin-antitoxin system VapC family toxin [Acidimicrobiales bacterium]